MSKKDEFQAFWLGKAENPTQREFESDDCPIPEEPDCKKCPINWPDDLCYSFGKNGYGLVLKYDAMIKAGSLANASEIARQIAELLWREV